MARKSIYPATRIFLTRCRVLLITRARARDHFDLVKARWGSPLVIPQALPQVGCLYHRRRRLNIRNTFRSKPSMHNCGIPFSNRSFRTSVLSFLYHLLAIFSIYISQALPPLRYIPCHPMFSDMSLGSALSFTQPTPEIVALLCWQACCGLPHRRVMPPF